LASFGSGGYDSDDGYELDTYEPVGDKTYGNRGHPLMPNNAVRTRR